MLRRRRPMRQRRAPRKLPLQLLRLPPRRPVPVRQLPTLLAAATPTPKADNKAKAATAKGASRERVGSKARADNSREGKAGSRVAKADSHLKAARVVSSPAVAKAAVSQAEAKADNQGAAKGDSRAAGKEAASRAAVRVEVGSP